MSYVANIELHKGEDAVITVTMTPVTNITGWALAFNIRRSPDDPTALVTKTTLSGMSITNPSNGVFTITLDRADTRDLDYRELFFDIQRTDTGFRTVLTYGSCTLLPKAH